MPEKKWLAYGAPVLLGLLLQTGCAPAPLSEKPVAVIPAGWRHMPEKTLASAADAKWWESLNDATLSSLVTIALQENPTVRIAHLRVEQARQAARLTGTALFPRAIGMAGASYLDDPILRNFSSPTHIPYFNLSTLVSYELDWFGKLADRQNGTLSQMAAEEFDLHTAAFVISASVVSTYIQAGFVHQRLVLMRDMLMQSHRIQALLRARRDAGMAREEEWLTVAQTVQNQEAALLQLEQIATETRQTLALLLGDRLQETDLTQIRLPVLEKITPIMPGLPSDLLLRRPDIRAAEARLVTMYFNVETARKAFFPDLALTLEGGWANTALSTLFKCGGINIGFSMLSPLTQGNNLSAEHERAVITYRIETEQYLDTIRKSFAEVEEALSAQAAFAQEAHNLQTALSLASRAEDIARIRHTEGVTSRLALLHQNQVRTEAELAVLDNQRRQLLTFVKLGKALGGTWKVPVLARHE